MPEGGASYLGLGVVHGFGLILDLGAVLGHVIGVHDGGDFSLGDVGGLNDGAVNGLELGLSGVHDVGRHLGLGHVRSAHDGLIGGGDDSFGDVGWLNHGAYDGLILGLGGVHNVGQGLGLSDVLGVHDGLIGGGVFRLGDVGGLEHGADHGAVLGLIISLGDRDVVVDGGGDVGWDGHGLGQIGLDVLGFAFLKKREVVCEMRHTCISQAELHQRPSDWKRRKSIRSGKAITKPVDVFKAHMKDYYGQGGQEYNIRFYCKLKLLSRYDSKECNALTGHSPQGT